MKFHWPWQRKPKLQMPQREYVQIDVRVPRQAYYRNLGGQPPGPCPKCGGELHISQQMYVIATRQGKRLADSFLINGDFGWYCSACPSVVIDLNELGEMVSYGLPQWEIGNKVAVLGIVDMEAVPEDKKHVPLGEDDNPIPLVEFYYPTPAGGAKTNQPTSSSPARRTGRGHRRSGRGAPRKSSKK